MIRINLLPVKAAQKKEMLKGQLMVVVLVLIVTAGLCFVAYTYTQGEINARQATIDQKRADIAKLSKVIKEVRDFEKRQKELRAKLDVLDQLKASRGGPLLVLNALYEELPEKLWLTNFQEGNGRASISGIGVNEETVALFMKNLESSVFFDGVELRVTRQIVQDNIKFQQFDLTCRTFNKKPETKK